MVVLDFSYEGLNKASSLRMHLWSNAVTVLKNHPINGAGVRSYRYAYAKYAEEGDPYVRNGTGMIYALNCCWKWDRRPVLLAWEGW